MNENGDRRSQKKIKKKQDVRQECLLSPVLFNLYVYHTIIELQDNNFLQTNILTTLPFVDDQVIMAASEYFLRALLHQLPKTASTYDYIYS
jgi:hypothetical protein